MSPNLKAFLRVIREGESSQDDSAYTTIVGGEHFTDFTDHPRKLVNLPKLKVKSTAAGAYQFLARTWDECAKALKLPDFSPASQDAAAVFLIKRRGALADIDAGNLESAIAKCAREWASLPGSPYGQPVMPLKRAVDVFLRWGGTLAPTQAKEAHMAPFVAAALPSLIQLLPRLSSLFGSGSDVSNRNVKAAEMAATVIVDAIGARNVQEAVETLKADPAAVQQATKALESRWLELTEAGGDGIAGARKADLEYSKGKLYQSPSFIIALVLLPLVYIFVFSLVGMMGSATWSDDVRAGLAGSIIGSIIGGLVGYYFGQTTSRNREP